MTKRIKCQMKWPLKGDHTGHYCTHVTECLCSSCRKDHGRINGRTCCFDHVFFVCPHLAAYPQSCPDYLPEVKEDPHDPD